MPIDPNAPRFAIFDEGKVATITNPRQQDLRDRLPPGIYQLQIQRSFFGQQILFYREELLSEGYVDMGGPAGRVMDIARAFFAGEHKERLAKHRMLNKLFLLLHGPPGTGKTLVANELARLAIDNEVVVLRLPRDSWDESGLSNLQAAVKAIREITPNQVVMFQLDDAEWVFNYEKRLIAMLDGDQQQDNLLWTVTTNYPTKVTERVMGRTRRIQFQFPFGPPSTPMRRRYLEAQGVEGIDLEQYIIATKGKTIDQIAGLIASTVLYGQPADEVLQDTALREHVRTGRLDYAVYMENYYGEDRQVAADASQVEEGYIIDPNSGRKVSKALLEQQRLEKEKAARPVQLAWLLHRKGIISKAMYDELVEFLDEAGEEPA